MSHSVRPSECNFTTATGAMAEEECFPVEEEQMGNEQDDDQTGGEDSGEVQAARNLGQPRLPSERERREHERTHCPARSWCEHCARGQGAEYGHPVVVGVAAE